MPDDNRKGRTGDEVAAVLGLEDGPGRRRHWSRRVALIAVLLLAVGGGYALFRDSISSRQTQYQTDAALRGDITVVVTATGTVEPTNTVEISSELSGIIRTVKVDYNSEVRVGEVLAELDTDRLKASVASSRARVQAAKANVVEAEATIVEKQRSLQRTQELARRSFASTQDLDAARATHDRAVAALDSAKADVAAAEADLSVNETNLGKSCICSPIDGVVLARDVEPGQVVAASLQAPVLFTIAEDLTQMEVQVDVDEADVGQVRVGQAASFTVDAYPERTFSAEIRQLRFGSETVQGVVTYKAVLSADNAELLLRPGMTATAEITVGEARDVLTVSNEALRFTPPTTETESSGRGILGRLLPGRPQFRAASAPEQTGSSRRVWVLRGGVPGAVEIEIGVSDGTRTEIRSGALADGQKVIVDATVSSN